ncbi:triose-phosphate transporter family-domain-containing protein [Obelidium mucronatum]|nr:triose-phosphate transporter family-domain-containing protein [Obelidium mucronatum]
MSEKSSFSVHPAVYIAVWIFCSGSVILFNKYILHTLEFPFPIFLTTCHLVFATIATRILERTTPLLKNLKNVEITQDVFRKAILPIGFFFSMSLVFSNNAYLYLSVPFIQMLKVRVCATTPVAVLLVGYALGIEKTDYLILAKVSAIVVGVIIASYGEIEFVLIGVLFQVLGIATEATRLVMVQQLLKDYKMDPMVSLYHFAPVCAIMNGIACIIVEGNTLTYTKFTTQVGFPILLLNCTIALCLNISVVFLIGKTSSLVMCLSGVFKDILLVAISVLIWASPVTVLQVFGYGIALIGLVWYKQPDIDGTGVKKRNPLSNQ